MLCMTVMKKGNPNWFVGTAGTDRMFWITGKNDTKLFCGAAWPHFKSTTSWMTTNTRAPNWSWEADRRHCGGS